MKPTVFNPMVFLRGIGGNSFCTASTLTLSLGVALLSSCGTSSTPTADGGAGSTEDASVDASPAVDTGTADAAIEDAGPSGALDSGVGVSDSGIPIDSDAGARTDAGAPRDTGCGQVSTGGTWNVDVGGDNREFTVRLPPNYDANVPTPVVLNFHGSTFDSTSHQAFSRMNPVADREGFIVVYGQGTGAVRSWNGGPCCWQAQSSNTDDVGFTAAMIDELEARLCVDRDRVFATGMSAGGFLSYRLACELSDRIAAIAPVAGEMGTGAAGVDSCAPTRPVPVLHIHGTSDAIVPYSGNASYVSAQGSAEFWAMENACDASPTTYFSEDDTECVRWSGCEQDADVELCTVTRGGHTWPGGMSNFLLGRTSNTISASEVIWDFFRTHPRQTP